jgi:hypothetical protein
MASGSSERIVSFRAAALGCFIVLAVGVFALPRQVISSVLPAAEPKPQKLVQGKRPPAPGRRGAGKGPDYTKFSHRTSEHQLSCDTCHKFPSKNWKEARKASDSFPDITEFPEHSSCLTCHRQQFFARERPAPRICSVCHVAITPRLTARKTFPDLSGRESDFRIGFSHVTHVDLVGSNRPRPETRSESRIVSVGFRLASYRVRQESEPKSCAVCHQNYQPQGTSDDEFVSAPPKDLGDAFWLKKGTFKTTPRDHATCFSCHSEETGILPAPASCNSCHKLTLGLDQLAVDVDQASVKRMGITDPLTIAKWDRRSSSGTFRHEGGMHPTLNCTGCHRLETMNTVERKTLRVPVLSCGGAGGGCHVTATADDGGILNYEADKKKSQADFNCVKCHVVFGRGATPASHLDAIANAPKN